MLGGCVDEASFNEKSRAIFSGNQCLGETGQVAKNRTNQHRNARNLDKGQRLGAARCLTPQSVLARLCTNSHRLCAPCLVEQ